MKVSYKQFWEEVKRMNAQVSEDADIIFVPAEEFYEGAVRLCVRWFSGVSKDAEEMAGFAIRLALAGDLVKAFNAEHEGDEVYYE